MLKNKLIKTALLCCMLYLPVLVMGQPPRGPLARSPIVNADKTVTFNYISATAKDVKLSGQFLKAPATMTKGAQHNWTVTVGPVAPDIYPYNFVVDGISVMDPANEYFFTNERFKGSLLDVQDNPPLIHALQDVPHGTVTYEYYPAAGGTTGTLVVYTPPGYDKNSTKKYPVFYLISGTTDTEETFFKVGKANLILDNLIAQGKAKPMILVMPYGNVEGRIAEQKGGKKPADPAGRESDEAVTRALAFSKDVTQHMIPYIDKTYRVLPGRDNRAIGGFSRGGGETLRTGLGNLDKFSYICSYSAYLSPAEMDKSYSFVAGKPQQTNKLLKLLWVSVGSEDFMYKPTSEFLDYLKAHQVNYKSMISGGAHTWMNVKNYLATTAPLLFK
ncbi:MAG: alpha/beta hydrolase-fold protein [Mucilaginibacter sp.]